VRALDRSQQKVELILREQHDEGMPGQLASSDGLVRPAANPGRFKMILSPQPSPGAQDHSQSVSAVDSGWLKTTLTAQPTPGG
jgi:hypothetical protein